MRDIRHDSIRLVLAGLFLLGVAPVLSGAAQHERHAITQSVGEKGEITLTTETRIADITLKPGRYYIDHRVQETLQPRRVFAHYIHFTEVTPESTQRRRAAREALGGTAVAHPGEIECKVEALPKKASKTTVVTTIEDGVPRITRIEIAGENMAHVL